MARLALFFLGTPRLEQAGTAVEVATRKAMALLAYLTVTGVTHSRDALATLFWSESSQKRARASLRSTLLILKTALGEELFMTDYHEVSLNRQADLWLDVAEFRRLLNLAGQLNPCRPRLAPPSNSL